MLLIRRPNNFLISNKNNNLILASVSTIEHIFSNDVLRGRDIPWK